jgi:hypothetical protein
MDALMFKVELAIMWLFVVVSQGENIVVVAQGTGEGKYRAGYYWSLRPGGSLTDIMNRPICDDYIRSSLHEGLGDDRGILYVRLYVQNEKETSWCALLTAVSRIDKLADPSRTTKVILYMNFLEGLTIDPGMPPGRPRSPTHPQ